MLETDELKEMTSIPVKARSTSDLSRQQLEAIRDEWLAPLLMQMRHQSEEVGRLQVQCQQLRDERDTLIAERDELREKVEAGVASNGDSESSENGKGSSFIAQLHTTEGAMITGIAIAIGLWFGIGTLTWMMLG